MKQQQREHKHKKEWYYCSSSNNNDNSKNNIKMNNITGMHSSSSDNNNNNNNVYLWSWPISSAQLFLLFLFVYLFICLFVLLLWQHSLELCHTKFRVLLHENVAVSTVTMQPAMYCGALSVTTLATRTSFPGIFNALKSRMYWRISTCAKVPDVIYSKGPQSAVAFLWGRFFGQLLKRINLSQ